MARYPFAVLSVLAAAAVSLVSNSSSAMNAQEFFAAEARGEYGSPRVQHQAQLQYRGQIAVPQRTRQASLAQPSAFTGVNLGGSWLASNMGATRPSGAPGAWCGYAMRMEMVSQGYGDPGPQFNLVSSWCRVGSPAPVGAVGSIFVSRGHVSKVVAGNCPAGTVATISGNATGRRVSHMCEPLSRAVCSRWPGRVNS